MELHESNTTVEFSETEKESLRKVCDIIRTIKNAMTSRDVAEDNYGNIFLLGDLGSFEELLDSLGTDSLEIRKAEK